MTDFWHPNPTRVNLVLAGNDSSFRTLEFFASGQLDWVFNLLYQYVASQGLGSDEYRVADGLAINGIP